MRGMLPIAVISVAAVATAGIALSIATARDGSVQLQPDGIVVTPASSGSGGPASADAPPATGTGTPGPDAGAPAGGADAVTANASPEGTAADSSGGVQTVPPAPAHTLPPQAATGRPESPGKSADHRHTP